MCNCKNSSCGSNSGDSGKSCSRGIASQLRRHVGQWVVVYEKNAIAVGFVTDVRNNSALVLGDALKFVFDFRLILEFDQLVISVCEITEFAPLSAAARTTLVNNLRANINA